MLFTTNCGGNNVNGGRLYSYELKLKLLLPILKYFSNICSAFKRRDRIVTVAEDSILSETVLLVPPSKVTLCLIM